MKTYCYSFNNEDFIGEFTSKKELIKEALDDWKDRKDWDKSHKYDILYIGTNKSHTISELFDAECLLDDMVQRAGDLAGEYGEEWVENNIYGSDLSGLQKTIVRWLNKRYGKPSFYSIQDIKEIKIEKLI